MTSDDSFFATLKMNNNKVVQMSFDLFSRTPRIYIEITGKKGTIIWDRVNHQIKIYNRKTNKWKIEQFDLKNLMSMYPSQAKYFYNCLIKQKNTINNIKEALKTQQIIDAGFRSSERQKVVKL